MISREEILEFAREFQLAPNIVEKDYALGWLLAGIANHHELKDSWVFKGGTCLKKCFFETYRFSEDLDFTLRDPAHLNEDFLSRVFGEIAAWVYESTGLEMPADARRFETFTNPRGRAAAQGRVGYRGGQLQYIFECPVCHKRFIRSSYDATLNRHKNKQGWDCYGSGGAGIYRGTRH